MNTCSVCAIPLPTALDEFGPVKKTVCRDCFFVGDIPTGEEREKLKERIEEIDEEIGQLEWEIDELETQQRKLEREMQFTEEELNGRIAQITPTMVKSWKQGLPKHVKDTPYDPTRSPLLLFH